MKEKAPATTKEHEMINAHSGLWKGGYAEGDPLDPYGVSDYGQLGFMSILHAVYQVCIRPYINPNAKVVEIGCGRGAWTKTMLEAGEIWCLDVQSAEENRFWEYIGPQYRNKVKYIQVSDFSCRDLPLDSFDFLFSFGTFCHIPWEGQSKYYQNLFPKLKKGATGMVMFADYDKYDAVVAKYGDFSISIQGPEENAFTFTLRNGARFLRNVIKGSTNHHCRIWHKFNKIDRFNPGLWFSPGIERMSQFLKETGYEVVNPDIGLCIRDAVVHFRKPL